MEHCTLVRLLSRTRMGIGGEDRGRRRGAEGERGGDHRFMSWLRVSVQVGDMRPLQTCARAWWWERRSGNRLRAFLWSLFARCAAAQCGV